ncbi:MAG TPA: hypothetical protein VJP77_04655 [Planctomycetota bacterium]|nr:hypothetical protein [Planctomycetota bacterium]
MARVPAHAFDDYVALGPDRSYRELARRYSCSKTAISKKAMAEDWQGKLAELESKARVKFEEKAVDQLEAVRERHLKEARFLQSRALQALRDLPPEKGIRAAAALGVAWRHELLLLGEPTERQANVEELIRRETRELLRVVEDDEDDIGFGRRGSG